MPLERLVGNETPGEQQNKRPGNEYIRTSEIKDQERRENASKEKLQDIYIPEMLFFRVCLIARFAFLDMNQSDEDSDDDYV